MKEEKENKIVLRKQELIEQEMKECSFKPNLISDSPSNLAKTEAKPRFFDEFVQKRRNIQKEKQEQLEMQ